MARVAAGRRSDQLTGVSGIGFLYEAIEICAAICSATEKNALDDGDSGSLSTIGTPLSPPWRMGSEIGTWPRNGIFMSFASPSPPPLPKMSLSVLQVGHTK